MPRVYMDEDNGRHVSQRIREHFPDAADQKIMVDMVKKLLTLQAPPEALGQYQWHVNIGEVGRIVMRGHSVRTVYPYSYNFPGGIEYKVADGRLVRA